MKSKHQWFPQTFQTVLERVKIRTKISSLRTEVCSSNFILLNSLFYLSSGLKIWLMSSCFLLIYLRMIKHLFSKVFPFWDLNFRVKGFSKFRLFWKFKRKLWSQLTILKLFEALFPMILNLRVSSINMGGIMLVLIFVFRNFLALFHAVSDKSLAISSFFSFLEHLQPSFYWTYFRKRGFWNRFSKLPVGFPWTIFMQTIDKSWKFEKLPTLRLLLYVCLSLFWECWRGCSSLLLF